MRGGCDFGDLFVEVMVVGREGEDLRYVGKCGDSIDVVEDGGEVVACGLLADVGNARHVFADGGGPGESVALRADDEASVFGMGRDGEVFPERGVFSEEGLQGGDVGEPERNNE